MVPIKPHAYAELPDEFHTYQMWQGFKNPLLVTQNVELKKELGFQDVETQKRLNTWCTRGKTKPFGEYAMRGATEGKAYGEKNIDSPDNLRRINDFDWLMEKFND